MRKLFQDTAFGSGFMSGISLFIGLNIYSLAANYGECIDCYGRFGFHFPLEDSGNLLVNIMWFGLIADILFALIFSFVVGLIFKSIWSKIISRRLNLK